MKQTAKKTHSNRLHQRRVLAVRIMLAGVGLALGLGVAGCRLSSSSKPSALVIAVDQFGLNQINCYDEDNEDSNSGIALLCQESVRFTHAYTTSILSGPALTSVLTGQYPFQHGLRSNKKNFLSSKSVTLAEVAQKQQVATAFFSGGAPILRKLNLQQGFEVFDDHFAPTQTRLHRPFSRLQKLFENWYQDNRGRSFLAFFYVPDLALTQTPTTNDRGEARNLSYESQVEEFDESLWHFIHSMKERKIWDSTTVVLVGLNGPDTTERAGELANTNLYSERTQVGLLIKPARRNSGETNSSSYDGGVNLADLGNTLIELYGDWKSDSTWPLMSLNGILKSTSSPEIEERPLRIETAWSEAAGIRTAIRWGANLFLLDEKPRIFNSLTDKLETVPVRPSDPSVREKWQDLEERIDSSKITLWSDLPPATWIKWKGISHLWSLPAGSIDRPISFERLAHRLYDDSEISEMYTRELIRGQTWEERQRWAQGLKISDLEKIANRNLKIENRRSFQDPCLAALELSQPQTQDLKKCEDPLAWALLEWVMADRSEGGDATQKENLRKKFLRLYTLNAVDQKVTEINWSLENVWDLSPSLRRPALTTDLMLALPDLQKYKQIAQKAVVQARDEGVSDVN